MKAPADGQEPQGSGEGRTGPWWPRRHLSSKPRQAREPARSGAAPSCCGSEAAASKPARAPWREARWPRMAPGARPGRSGSRSLPQGLGACTHVHTSEDDDLPRKPRPGVHHRDLGFRPRQGRPARLPAPRLTGTAGPAAPTAPPRGSLPAGCSAASCEEERA